MLSDNIPIFGYHRKSYLFISGMIGMISLASMPFVETETISIIVLMASEISQCLADIIADAVMIEASRNDPETGSGKLQSFCWLSFAIGGLIGGTLGGIALDYMSPQHVIGFLTVCPFIILCVSIGLKEEKDMSKVSFAKIQGKSKKIWEALTDSRILKSLFVIYFARACSPTFGELMTYFMRDQLDFSATFLSLLNTLTYVMMAVGSILYSKFIVNWEFHTAIGVGQILLTFLGGVDVILTTKFYNRFCISPYLFVVGGDAFAGVVEYTFRKLPLLVLGGQLCPVGIEATLFALFASVSNFGYSSASFEGALIMKMTGINSANNPDIWILFSISAVSHILLLPFLGLLPRKNEESKEKDDLNQPLL